MSHLFEAHSLVKRYGHHTAVDDVSLDISPGEVVALIGPNGAGKSTTLEIILGLRPADGGNVVFWRDDPWREIGIQLQTTPFFRGLTAAENLQLFASFYGVRLSRAQIAALLERCDLSGAARIALLKLDIEGTEYEVFERLRREDLIRIDRLAIEFHEHLRPGTRELLASRLSPTHNVIVCPDPSGLYGMIFAAIRRDLADR